MIFMNAHLRKVEVNNVGNAASSIITDEGDELVAQCYTFRSRSLDPPKERLLLKYVRLDRLVVF